VLVVDNAGLLTTAQGITVSSGKNLTLNGEAFNDLTGNGLSISSSALTLNLTSSGTTGATSSNSGLEVSSAGLTLLKGCSDNQTLSYTDAGGWACSTPATPGFTTSGGIITQATTTDKVNLKVGEAGDYGLLIDTSVTPTVDIAQISNTANASTTNGVDGLAVNFSASNASGDAFHITPVYAGGANDGLTFNAMEVEAFSPTNAAGTDTVNGLKIGALTDPGTSITSTALSIGSGWDEAINAGGIVTIGAQADTTDHTFGSTCACLLNSAAGTFGAQTGRDAVVASVVFRGKLFVSTRETDAAGVYRYDGGTTWTLVTNAVGKAVTG
jgi:hypothetical protein